MSSKKSDSSRHKRGLGRTNSVASRGSREGVRRGFRPRHVRALFIGESPPASGRFFYRGDSGLYRAMLQAFHTGDPSITSTNFLSAFRAHGCYLIDLSPDPVDRLSAQDRRDTCRKGEASLSRAIARLRPTLIVTVVRSIEGNVARAIGRAAWRGPVIGLPYPGRWSQFRLAFLEGLAPTIKSLLYETERPHTEQHDGVREQVEPRTV